MEYFLYSSMLCQLKVYDIVKTPARVNLLGTSKLPGFERKVLIFLGHTLSNKKPSRKF